LYSNHKCTPKRHEEASTKILEASIQHTLWIDWRGCHFGPFSRIQSTTSMLFYLLCFIQFGSYWLLCAFLLCFFICVCVCGLSVKAWRGFCSCCFYYPVHGYVRFISMLGLSWVSFSFSPAWPSSHLFFSFLLTPASDFFYFYLLNNINRMHAMNSSSLMALSSQSPMRCHLFGWRLHHFLLLYA
jgi:hypothetical protein